MKKLIAICMALMLLYAVPASAAQWPEGRSASKPYAGKPEVDFSKTVGYMMFYPRTGVEVVGGLRTLFIYLPREDVKAGDGELTLRSDEDRSTWSVAFSNTDYVRQRDMVEEELVGLMWGSGACFEITLPVSVSLNRHYYVDLGRDCIISHDGTVSNPELPGEKSWYFSTEADFGVSEMEYRRALSNGGYDTGIVTPAVGDEIRLDVVLGGEATTAVLYQYSGADFGVTTFTEDGEAIGTVTAEDPDWGVLFFDASGNQVGVVQF